MDADLDVDDVVEEVAGLVEEVAEVAEVEEPLVEDRLLEADGRLWMKNKFTY